MGMVRPGKGGQWLTLVGEGSWDGKDVLGNGMARCGRSAGRTRKRPRFLENADRGWREGTRTFWGNVDESE